MVTVPTVVPPSLKKTCLPSASRIMSAGLSIVISPVDVANVTAASPVLISSRAADVLSEKDN